jgi:adenylylsulfate kinase-like enzyme
MHLVVGPVDVLCSVAVMSIPTLLITGTISVGKSTVASEINGVLSQLGVANAAVDLDVLT